MLLFNVVSFNFWGARAAVATRCEKNFARAQTGRFIPGAKLKDTLRRIANPAVYLTMYFD